MAATHSPCSHHGVDEQVLALLPFDRKGDEELAAEAAAHVSRAHQPGCGAGAEASEPPLSISVCARVNSSSSEGITENKTDGGTNLCEGPEAEEAAPGQGKEGE